MPQLYCLLRIVIKFSIYLQLNCNWLWFSGLKIFLYWKFYLPILFLFQGYKVSDTVRKGILDVTMYEGAEQELMMGCLAALSSSAVWLLVATFLKLPISGTHSIVGSTIGFSLVARGTNGLNWTTLGTIVASWFISPVLSGLVSTSLYWLIQRMIVFAKNPLRAGLLSLPVFYGITVAVNVLSIVHDGPKCKPRIL